jgi:hypothetical protein
MYLRRAHSAVSVKTRRDGQVTKNLDFSSDDATA